MMAGMSASAESHRALGIWGIKFKERGLMVVFGFASK